LAEQGSIQTVLDFVLSNHKFEVKHLLGFSKELSVDFPLFLSETATRHHLTHYCTEIQRLCVILSLLHRLSSLD
jgi:hypothetical protein